MTKTIHQRKSGPTGAASRRASGGGGGFSKQAWKMILEKP